MHVKKANTFVQKLRGLIGTSDSNHTGDALHLMSCKGVHTWFMSYSIDVAFLDKDGKAIKVHRSVKPFRLVKGGRRVCSTIERKASTAPWPSTGQHVETIEHQSAEED